MAQKIEMSQDSTSVAESAQADRRLRFEGTVELGGAVTGQMLNILFGPDSNVNGKLQFDGSVHIDGRYGGVIKTEDALVVGEHAKIVAEISCGSAAVQGEIIGNITARESVALLAPARVKGDITAPALSIEKGVVFDGVSHMGTTSRSRRNRP